MKQTTIVLLAILIAMSSFCQCTPGSVRSAASLVNLSSIGTLAWGNPENAAASDNARAAITALSLGGIQTTNYLSAANFGFSIPGTAVICGVVVEIEKHQTGLSLGASIKDNVVKLAPGGIISGTNLKSPDDWSGSENYISYGGNNNLWGLTLTPSIINNSSFGVVIAADMTRGIGLPTANINHIRMTVYYNIILPVIWTYFTATEQDNRILLKWSTAAETGNRHFIIERSEDGNTWRALDTISGRNIAADYQWYDLHPGNMNSYRIRQVDLDGHSYFSKTVTIKLSSPAPGIKAINNMPGTITIQSSDNISHAEVFDLLGRKKSFTCLEKSGLRNVLYSSGIVPGFYIIRVFTSRSQYTTKAFMR